VLKKILFQAHWLLGITLGTILAFSGITGALIAYQPQLNAQFGPEAQRVAVSGAPLTPSQLYLQIQRARPDRAVDSLSLSANPAAPVRIRFLRGVPRRGGPGGDIAYADPYSGRLLPSSTRVSTFLQFIERLHRGMWAGNGSAGTVVRAAVSWAAMALLLMAISGLYLRWPRGRAKWNWRSWFRINFALKGPAFLWSLHAVLGTTVLLLYVLSAHSGVMTGHQLAWYQGDVQSVEASLGIRRNGPGERGGPGGPGRPGRLVDSGSAAGSRGAADLDLERVWTAFLQRVPHAQNVEIDLPSSAAAPVTVRYRMADASSVDNQLAFDARTGEPRAMGAAQPNRPANWRPPVEPLLSALLNGRKDVHTGERWGVAGESALMLSSLGMPVFYVTGWMMYLQRRQRNRVRRMRGATPDWQRPVRTSPGEAWGGL